MPHGSRGLLLFLVIILDNIIYKIYHLPYTEEYIRMLIKINRRKTEISEKVRDYCDAKINEINLAGSREPAVIVEKRVNVRPGIGDVPNFVTPTPT